jgi:hypothetical protein
MSRCEFALMRCDEPNATCTMLTMLVCSHSQQHQGDNGVMLAEARALVGAAANDR